MGNSFVIVENKEFGSANVNDNFQILMLIMAGIALEKSTIMDEISL
ncbi:hypothetical protein AB3U99_22030 [Niallia sp. JL1B1071]